MTLFLNNNYLPKGIVFRNLLLVVALFCITIPLVNAQISNEAFKNAANSNLKKGEILQIEFESLREGKIKDTGRWKNKVINDNTIEVDFMVEHTSSLNPYKAEYKYFIKLLEGDSFQVDMTAALNPMSLRIAEDYTIGYEGDALFFPANLESATALPVATGVFSILKPTGEKLLGYEVNVTNRKIQMIEVNGIEGFVFQHTYDLRCQSITNNGFMVADSNDQVAEILSPYIGMISQNRITSTRTMTNGEKGGRKKRETSNKVEVEIKLITKK